jgi:outer membrane biogenesis lipoprotein LolB
MRHLIPIFALLMLAGCAKETQQDHQVDRERVQQFQVTLDGVLAGQPFTANATFDGHQKERDTLYGYRPAPVAKPPPVLGPPPPDVPGA